MQHDVLTLCCLFFASLHSDSLHCFGLAPGLPWLPLTVFLMLAQPCFRPIQGKVAAPRTPRFSFKLNCAVLEPWAVRPVILEYSLTDTQIALLVPFFNPLDLLFAPVADPLNLIPSVVGSTSRLKDLGELVSIAEFSFNTNPPSANFLLGLFFKHTITQEM